MSSCSGLQCRCRRGLSFWASVVCRRFSRCLRWCLPLLRNRTKSPVFVTVETLLLLLLFFCSWRLLLTSLVTFASFRIFLDLSSTAVVVRRRFASLKKSAIVSCIKAPNFVIVASRVEFSTWVYLMYQTVEPPVMETAVVRQSDR